MVQAQLNQHSIDQTHTIKEVIVHAPQENRQAMRDVCIKEMVDAYDGDVLVVDRLIEKRHGSIVIAKLDGELTVKQLELRPKARLVPRNKDYPEIDIKPEMTVEIIGAVRAVIRKLVV